MLKPMLARGELHCIGATTLDEYRQYIEKDAALERRFQPVMVDEPTVEDTISILAWIERPLRSFPWRKDYRCSACQQRQYCQTVTSRIVSFRIRRLTLSMRHVHLSRPSWIRMPTELDDVSA